jgi:hypothetical protein
MPAPESSDPSTVVWTVAEKRPEHYGRKSTRIREVIHSADSCAHALEIMAHVEGENGQQLSTQLRANGSAENVLLDPAAVAEYQAACKALAARGEAQR